MSLRTLGGLVLVVGYMVFIGVPGLVIGMFDPRRRLILGITRLWGRLILWVCGVKVAVSGLENLPSGPALYAANHASALDIAIVFGRLPVDFRIIYKKSLNWAPIVGGFLAGARHVAIDRQNAFNARRSLEAAAQRVRGGLSVLVFPEGTRSRDGAVQPFKRGSFVLAQETGVPIVPVSIVGVRAVAPGGILSARPGRVDVHIHPPVPSVGRSTDELAREVREIVVKRCEAPAS